MGFRILVTLAFVLVSMSSLCGQPFERVTVDLNGQWDFDQTDAAFPPSVFSRTIPVPGLISEARPVIDGFQSFFRRPDRVAYGSEHDVLRSPYPARYNWYRKRFFVPEHLEGRRAVITLLKSQYVTQVLLNGLDLGTSMACYTPVEFQATHAVQFGQENEILVRVGDRAWLPSQAAGSTDKEKVLYLPGIWDDVAISFTGDFRIDRTLVLPSLERKTVLVKILARSFRPPQSSYGGTMADDCLVQVRILGGEAPGQIAATVEKKVALKRDNLTQLELSLALESPHPWTPDAPRLYTAEITLAADGQVSDRDSVRFGMRDFKRQGKHFTLNGKRIFLRGTNVTLHRFFEDPDCGGLPWDRQWVKRLLIDIPKRTHWNAMRICVGIAPRMWYDLADEYGLLIQNEWLYWQNHGWDEQIRKEYTDWVWSDGNHPSIVIWDAINENWDDYIGNILIPELKRLDPTRIWDAGYMTSEHMLLDEMDEPHPYCVYGMDPNLKENLAKSPYPLGDLHYWPERFRRFLESSAAQLVNEYGWMWLWRDGRPARLMQYSLPYYLGETSTVEERRSFQAYWEQLQTEWLRTERSFAGVLSFCYLTNNYGFTGDWFTGHVKDLNPAPALEWFRHAFSPAAVFIDLPDERFTKHILPHAPGSKLALNLVGVNDLDSEVRGSVKLRLLDDQGTVAHERSYEIAIAPYLKQYLPVEVQLPVDGGGYLLLAEFDHGAGKDPTLSRRYIKIGDRTDYPYFEYPLPSTR